MTYWDHARAMLFISVLILDIPNVELRPKLATSDADRIAKARTKY